MPSRMRSSVARQSVEMFVAISRRFGRKVDAPRLASPIHAPYSIEELVQLAHDLVLRSFGKPPEGQHIGAEYPDCCRRAARRGSGRKSSGRGRRKSTPASASQSTEHPCPAANVRASRYSKPIGAKIGIVDLASVGRGFARRRRATPSAASTTSMRLEERVGVAFARFGSARVDKREGHGDGTRLVRRSDPSEQLQALGERDPVVRRRFVDTQVHRLDRQGATGPALALLALLGDVHRGGRGDLISSRLREIHGERHPDRRRILLVRSATGGSAYVASSSPSPSVVVLRRVDRDPPTADRGSRRCTAPAESRGSSRSTSPGRRGRARVARASPPEARSRGRADSFRVPIDRREARDPRPSQMPLTPRPCASPSPGEPTTVSTPDYEECSSSARERHVATSSEPPTAALAEVLVRLAERLAVDEHRVERDRLLALLGRARVEVGGTPTLKALAILSCTAATSAFASPPPGGRIVSTSAAELPTRASSTAHASST